MKDLEKLLDIKLESSNYIVRLDGKGFSKFTNKFFKKPYDQRLDSIMQKVTLSLFKDFKVKFAYTQSDEITLVFDKTNDGFFEGRIQKIVSLISSKATSYFIQYLVELDMYDAMKVAPCFDGRVFEYKNLKELYESISFRYFDCLRNSRLNLSMFLNKKDRLNKSGKEIIELVKDKLDYFSLPLSYRKGTFFKKEIIEKENPYNKEEKVLRNIIKSMNIENFPNEEDFLDFFNISIIFGDLETNELKVHGEDEGYNNILECCVCEKEFMLINDYKHEIQDYLFCPYCGMKNTINETSKNKMLNGEKKENL